MGVPTFYRWLCSRFPKVTKDITSKNPSEDSEFPDSLFSERYDNLYLDMNGIVHPCCHPEHLPQPKNEEEMFEAIFDYIDRLVETIRPKKLLYLALDGVAPRAKMNQQRSRRFKAVYERELAKKQLLNDKKDDNVPITNTSNDDQIWDSNVITPGTPFMYRLGLRLEDYINKRLLESELWRTLSVILSDSNSPGEGEHKIVNFIRVQRQSTKYDPNTSHVIHGMDADLIMLALATHEPNFYILREIIPFKQFDTTIKQTDETVPYSMMLKKSWKQLQLIQIPVLREYLSYVFKECGRDLERCIDDLVLMCFFCGNDFLPHLPSMSITLGSIDQMIYLYQQIFPVLGGYLTDCGKINMPQLAIFTSYLTAVEHETLCLKGGNYGSANKKENPEDEATSKTGIDVTLGSPEVYKKSYYMQKLNCSESQVESQSSSMADEYVKGMEWVLEYYYQGIPSWIWYYPYHYAPFASDLRFKHHHDFKLGHPFTPFQQLMSVLPIQSSHCLPEKFAELMADSSSPIAQYYPQTLKLDPNGARYRYQWVALLPFIDESILLKTVEPLEKDLTDEERARNALTSDRIFINKDVAINKFLGGVVDYKNTDGLAIHMGKSELVNDDSINIYNFECNRINRHSSKLLKGLKPESRVLEIGDLMDESRNSGFNCHVAKRMISHYIHKPQNWVTRDRISYSKSWNQSQSYRQRSQPQPSRDELLGGYSIKRDSGVIYNKRQQEEDRSGYQDREKDNKRFKRV